MRRFWTGAILALSLLPATARAQEAVVGAPDAEALFTSPDPQLHANKQLVYKIIRDLLEAGRWDLADQYLTERYLQHNPNAASGRAGVIHFFTEVLKVEPKPIPEKIPPRVVFVTAEGDLVTVGFVHEQTDSRGEAYTTTWYDTWRILDGKADEHWDSALRP
ncbi:nuclear transport factor 2 family protein [Neomegalonema sp.]|uniref:nuclear transport factor 2 family protein n=1 Tax=Neomegalonema sp. TaxID=2039713 RepID=UPI00261226FE|nr:nuclear transport factor 2 family protein [Neomegalonema sp.]MDD2869257.1 nuclear transport factor 2 family protein [Neomegalonema sp.]